MIGGAQAIGHGVKLDDDAKPAPPLDPIPEFEPKAPKSPKDGGDVIDRFEAIIDPAFELGSIAIRSIEKQLRQAVLAEIAALDTMPGFRVSHGTSRGVHRLEVSVTRE
jgi:hypothetical protein